MASKQFTFGERLGISFTIEAACLSVASVTFILCFAGYRWVKRTLLGRSESPPPPQASDSSLFINLMLADFIQGLGVLPNVRWMARGSIVEDSLCTAQAVVKQVGIVGVSLTSLAIAIHTFCILVLRWKARPHLSKFVVLGVWIATGLIVGIANAVNRNKKYYGGTGYWCWIISSFKVEQIVTEYLWVWLAGASMMILYGIMFIVIRGWFTINEPESLGINQLETENDMKTKAIANSMLFYPAVYVLCVFPNSLSRWLFFSGFHPPYQFTLFANTLFSLSGMCNLILFFVTRPEVVVGPPIIREPEPGPTPVNPHHGRNDTINPPGGHGPNLGYLPERRHPGPPEEMEMQNYSEFSGQNSYSSPLPLFKQTSDGSRLTGTTMHPEWDRTHSTRSLKPSTSATVDQDEDSGRLPG